MPTISAKRFMEEKKKEEFTREEKIFSLIKSVEDGTVKVVTDEKGNVTVHVPCFKLDIGAGVKK